MKRIRFISLLIAVIMVMITGAGTFSAQAAGGVTVTVTASPSQLSTTGTVTLHISVKNSTSSAMTDVSVTGNGVNEILPTISSGETQDLWVDDYTVTDSMLGKPITFTVHYNGGQTATGSVTVSRLAVAPKVVLERTSSVSEQDIGKPVVFTYTVYNKGTNTVSNVIVHDKYTDAALNTAFSLTPGAQKKIQHTYIMKGNTVSRPSVSFSANGKSYINTIDALYITVPEEPLVVEVSATKDEVKPGEEITIHCKVSNQSGQKIKDISLEDEIGQALGDAFDLAKGQSKTVTKTFTLTDSRSYSVTATGYKNGDRVEASSEPIKMKLLQAEAKTGLSIEVKPDVTQLTEAGTVTFSITVSNKTEDTTLTDVVVSEQTQGEIETIDTLPAGGDRLVTRDFEVSGDQTYVFTASAKDADGNTYEVKSEDVKITVGQATATPSVTAAAAATAGSGLGTFLIIIIVIVALIIIAAVVLIVLSLQERKAQRLAAANPPVIHGEEVRESATEEPVENEEVSFIPPDIVDTETVPELKVEADNAPEASGAQPEPDKGKKIDDIENPVE